MTLLLVLLSGPCLYWTQGIESRATLEAAGIKQICVAPDVVDTWERAGFSARPLSEAELASREALPLPGITARAGLASPTRSPWIVANGWRFIRHPGKKYVYDAPAGKAAIAAAEAFAYGADAALKIDPADLAALGALGAMMTFFESVPAATVAPLADVGVVDDGSPVTGEVMNLLARRNLLFDVVQAPSPRYRINVVLGTAEYPRAEAGDPSAFALKIRRQLSDDQRTLRVYGSEVVICRATGNRERVRLHLINYGGREIEGLRIRLRGTYDDGEALVAGAGRLPLTDHIVAGGATEFSIPRITTYAVIDVRTGK